MAFSGCVCAAVWFDAFGCGFGFIVASSCMDAS
jgi:hypothetical protein